MKILISNYRYFVSGGPERYLFNAKKLMEDNGDTVYPFSVASCRNVPSEYEQYFMSAIGGGDSVYFDQYRKDPLTLAKILTRQFYSPEGFYKAYRFAKKTGADIVYSLHFLNKMSPSVIDGFKWAGLPVVARVSDFGMLCPQAHLYINGHTCDKCLSNGLIQAVKLGCVKNSKLGSLIKVVAYKTHRFIGSLDRVDAWIFPSDFTRKKHAEAGIDSAKLYHVPTFIESDNVRPDYGSQNHLLYFGRITEEKGVRQLLKAYDQLQSKIKLIIIGNYNDSTYSRALFAKYNDLVEFRSFMNRNGLSSFIRNAIAVVVPSICYDNFPNVVLEAFTHGKAAIAPAHGSFPEVISHLENGLLYDLNTPDGLASALDKALTELPLMRQMGVAAREYALAHHSPERHYAKLTHIFSEVIARQ